MAALLPNENEVRGGIKSGEFTADALILNALDLILSDYLVAIDFSVKNYVEENIPMDLGHAQLLLEYSRQMNKVFRKVMHPDEIVPGDGELLKKIKNQKPEMHKMIRQWLTHHIGNDSQAINFIIGDFVDDKKPVPVAYLKERVLPRIEAINDVLSALLAPMKR